MWSGVSLGTVLFDTFYDAGEATQSCFMLKQSKSYIANAAGAYLPFCITYWRLKMKRTIAKMISSQCKSLITPVEINDLAA